MLNMLNGCKLSQLRIVAIAEGFGTVHILVVPSANKHCHDITVMMASTRGLR